MNNIAKEMHKIRVSAGRVVFQNAQEAGVSGVEIEEMKARMRRWLKVLDRYSAQMVEVKGSGMSTGEQRRKMDALFHERLIEREEIFGEDHMSGVGSLLED